MDHMQVNMASNLPPGVIAGSTIYGEGGGDDNEAKDRIIAAQAMSDLCAGRGLPRTANDVERDTLCAPMHREEAVGDVTYNTGCRDKGMRILYEASIDAAVVMESTSANSSKTNTEFPMSYVSHESNLFRSEKKDELVINDSTEAKLVVTPTRDVLDASSVLESFKLHKRKAKRSKEERREAKRRKKAKREAKLKELSQNGNDLDLSSSNISREVTKKSKKKKATVIDISGQVMEADTDNVVGQFNVNYEMQHKALAPSRSDDLIISADQSKLLHPAYKNYSSYSGIKEPSALIQALQTGPRHSYILQHHLSEPSASYPLESPGSRVPPLSNNSIQTIDSVAIDGEQDKPLNLSMHNRTTILRKSSPVIMEDQSICVNQHVNDTVVDKPASNVAALNISDIKTTQVAHVNPYLTTPMGETQRQVDKAARKLKKKRKKEKQAKKLECDNSTKILSAGNVDSSCNTLENNNSSNKPHKLKHKKKKRSKSDAISEIVDSVAKGYSISNADYSPKLLMCANSGIVNVPQAVVHPTVVTSAQTQIAPQFYMIPVNTCKQAQSFDVKHSVLSPGYSISEHDKTLPNTDRPPWHIPSSVTSKVSPSYTAFPDGRIFSTNDMRLPFYSHSTLHVDPTRTVFLPVSAPELTYHPNLPHTSNSSHTSQPPTVIPISVNQPTNRLTRHEFPMTIATFSRTNNPAIQRLSDSVLQLVSSKDYSDKDNTHHQQQIGAAASTCPTVKPERGTSYKDSLLQLSPTTITDAPNDAPTTLSPSTCDTGRSATTMLPFKKRKIPSVNQEEPKFVINPAYSLQCLDENFLLVRPDEDGDIPLHIAVAREDLEAVKEYLSLMTQASCDIDVLNSDRQTPLHIAVVTNQKECARLLLKAGADIEIAGLHGATALHLAIAYADCDLLSVLLTHEKAGSCIARRDFDGFSVLHMAVIKRKLDVVKLLLQHVKDINIKDGKSGRSALFHAVENGDEEMVSLLLRHLANANVTNYAGNTPLVAASGRGFYEIAISLVSHGAETNCVDAARGSVQTSFSQKMTQMWQQQSGVGMATLKRKLESVKNTFAKKPPVTDSDELIGARKVHHSNTSVVESALDDTREGQQHQHANSPILDDVIGPLRSLTSGDSSTSHVYTSLDSKEDLVEKAANGIEVGHGQVDRCENTSDESDKPAVSDTSSEVVKEKGSSEVPKTFEASIGIKKSFNVDQQAWQNMLKSNEDSRRPNKTESKCHRSLMDSNDSPDDTVKSDMSEEITKITTDESECKKCDENSNERMSGFVGEYKSGLKSEGQDQVNGSDVDNDMGIFSRENGETNSGDVEKVEGGITARTNGDGMGVSEERENVREDAVEVMDEESMGFVVKDLQESGEIKVGTGSGSGSCGNLGNAVNVKGVKFDDAYMRCQQDMNLIVTGNTNPGDSDREGQLDSPVSVRDGQVDEVTDGQADEVTDGQADEVTDGQADEVTDRWADKVRDRQANEVRDGQADEVRNGQADNIRNGQTEEVMNGQADKIRDGQADEVRDGQADEVFRDGQADEVSGGEGQLNNDVNGRDGELNDDASGREGQLKDVRSTEGQLKDVRSTESQLSDDVNSREGQLNDNVHGTDGQLDDVVSCKEGQGGGSVSGRDGSQACLHNDWNVRLDQFEINDKPFRNGGTKMVEERRATDGEGNFTDYALVKKYVSSDKRSSSRQSLNDEELSPDAKNCECNDKITSISNAKHDTGHRVHSPPKQGDERLQNCSPHCDLTSHRTRSRVLPNVASRYWHETLRKVLNFMEMIKVVDDPSGTRRDLDTFQEIIGFLQNIKKSIQQLCAMYSEQGHIESKHTPAMNRSTAQLRGVSRTLIQQLTKLSHTRQRANVTVKSSRNSLKPESLIELETTDLRDNSIQPLQDNSIQPLQDNSMQPLQDNSIQPLQDNSIQVEQNNSIQVEQNNSIQVEQNNSIQVEQNNSIQVEQNNSMQPETTSPETQTQAEISWESKTQSETDTQTQSCEKLVIKKKLYHNSNTESPLSSQKQSNQSVCSLRSLSWTTTADLLSRALTFLVPALGPDATTLSCPTVKTFTHDVHSTNTTVKRDGVVTCTDSIDLI